MRNRFLLVSVAALLAAGSASAAGPGVQIFGKGYNLCHAVTLAALRTAGGQPYKAGKFSGATCNWATADQSAAVALSVHPADFMSLLNGYLKSSQAKVVKVPGSSRAIALTLSNPNGDTVQLYAGFPNGVVQVNVVSATSATLPTAVAIVEAVAHG